MVDPVTKMNRKDVIGGCCFWALMACALIACYSFVNQPVFSDACNSAKVTAEVSSCTYSFWTGRTDVFLGGLHLHYTGNLNLKAGATYEIVYRADSYRMLAWKLEDN